MDTLHGRVVKTTGSWILVSRKDAPAIPCKLKGQFKIHGKRATNPVAVGDYVDYVLTPGLQVGLITRIAERYNYIIRKSKKLSKMYHVIAANIDQAFLIVTASSPRTSVGFIDRFLTTAEAYHIPAGLIFNKIDLLPADKKTENYYHELLGVYQRIGYPCYSISVLTGENLDTIRSLFSHKTTLLSGHSGVGKSALINALDPKQHLRVGAISEYHDKGKHTTTFAEMLALSDMSYIIDTPGIREFGLTDFKKEEVAERYPEFRLRMHACQFSNCTHIHEPNCAVKTAVEAGEINMWRYNTYLAIVNDEDLEESEWA